MALVLGAADADVDAAVAVVSWSGLTTGPMFDAGCTGFMSETVEGGTVRHTFTIWLAITGR